MYKFLKNQKGAIESSLMTIMGFFLAATLMFIIPLMSIAERNNDIAQGTVQTAIAEFVNNAANAGAISQDEYNNLVAKLSATGNTFDITLEVQHLDENFGKKNNTTSADMIGENERYSTFYSNGIKEEVIVLKKGDIIVATAKNTNKTLATQLRSFAYRVTGKGTYEVAASASAMAINDGKVNK